jgi:DNA polymerase-3 subunit gamma/tau
VVTALYRRYRPENFAELIGQSQVTDPLRTALRTNRVNHAYLFSGPRGCGKTTSARILARCLNCAEGPTDTPCGVCPSCVELARGGGGSLDVIEIDAASHNGVDDARDLRDRAVFAPARDRYKIFILDEAHMVTPQGFNALLKLVEEPPEHVKFIFATTEPEKVIGTIRSRTHHYPFRLVPPATMLEYVEQLCEQESVAVAPGVLPLVVRAGGGSVRDTLSLLDQLMAGSEDGGIAYDRAVALLGYTDAALLDDVVDALAVADPASAFAAIDRVVQTGQDPRRFVEDLLERLRDLIVVAATNESAAAVLRGVSPEELDTMTRQAGVFGAVGLSRVADIANRALTEMTGATSPRLHLELMTARMLVPESDDTQRGALARVERLERRIGVGDAGGHQAEPTPFSGVPTVGTASTSAPAPAATAPAATNPAVAPAPATGATGGGFGGATSTQVTGAASTPAAAAATEPTEGRATTDAQASSGAGQSVADPGAAARDAAASWAAAVPSAPAPSDERAPTTPSGSGIASPSSTGQGTAVGDEPVARPVASVGFQQLKDSWPQIVEHVQRARRSAWSVVVTAQVTALKDDVLTLTFPSQQDVASFKEMSDPTTSVSELLRAAIVDVLGLRVKFVARGPGGAGQRPAQAGAGAGAGAAAGGRAGAAQERAPQGPGAQQPRVAQGQGPQQASARQPSQAVQGQAPQSSQGEGQAPQPSAADSPRRDEQQTSPSRTPADQSQGEASVSGQQQGQPERPQQGSSAAHGQDRPEPQRAAGQRQPEQRQPEQRQPERQQPERQQPEQQQPAQRQPERQQDATPATTTPSSPSVPVTEWAVATIPASDPTVGAVPEDVQPSWSAPFGTTDTGEPVAPAPIVSDPTVDAALAAQLRPASSFAAGTGRPAAAAAPTSAADSATSPTSAAPGAPAGPAASPSPSGAEVPMDDYPLDDEPYDDGAPFPDPGRPSEVQQPQGPSQPQRPQAQQHQQPQQQSQQAQPQQSQARTQQQSPPRQAPAAPQVRRTPVAGRYGEAVVREILNAQFIEETALHEEGA